MLNESRCFFHSWMRTVWVPYLKADFHFNYTLLYWMLLACFCAANSHSSMWALSLIFFAYFVDMHNRPCQKRLLVVWYQINSLNGFLFFFVQSCFMLLSIIDLISHIYQQKQINFIKHHQSQFRIWSSEPYEFSHLLAYRYALDS